MREIPIHSKKRRQTIDVTEEVAACMKDLMHKHQEGAIAVYSQHTTAGLMLNENADPTVQRDFLEHLASLVPQHAGFLHAEDNADSHIQAIITGAAALLPVSNGELALGVWQGLYLCEFDGPRQRKISCQFLPAAQ